MPTPHRIDTHTHSLSPDYSAWLKRKSAAAGGLPIPDWSVDLALASMEARRASIDRGAAERLFRRLKL